MESLRPTDISGVNAASFTSENMKIIHFYFPCSRDMVQMVHDYKSVIKGLGCMTINLHDLPHVYLYVLNCVTYLDFASLPYTSHKIIN